MELINSSNMKSFCRICFIECTQLVSLFDTKRDIRICDQILYCLNVSMKYHKDITNEICFNCLKELETVVKFKKKCEKSETKFEQFVNRECVNTNKLKTLTVNKSSISSPLSSNIYENVPLLSSNTKDTLKNNDTIHDKPLNNVDSEFSNIKNIDSTSSQCPKNEPTNRHIRKPIIKKKKFNSTDQHKCDTCNLQCQNKWVLKVHMRTHSGEKPFQCELCKKRFVSNSNMKMHIRLTHNDDKQVCSECGKSFSCLTYLKRHLIIHYKVKPYGCTICQKRFTTKSYLKEHIARHKGDKKFFCEICAAKFISDVNLKQHMLVHGIQKRNFKRHECTFCDYKTTGKVDLARHIRKHTGEKPFRCPEEGCHSAFAGKASLKLHVRIHTGEKPYTCSECPAKFSRGDKYKNHMLKKHNITNIISNKRSKLIVKELAEAVENGQTVCVPIDILKTSNSSS